MVRQIESKVLAPGGGQGAPRRLGSWGKRWARVSEHSAGLLGSFQRFSECFFHTALYSLQEDFKSALEDAGDKLVVVDFSATWCGPCKMIKPFFHSLSEKYSKVVFLEVDVDDCQDVAADCEVKCMPTFQFYKKGQKVGEFSGANKEKLEATINELS
ncbi:thioredoxin isoform X2 [Choloepus didactylus]|uniref:thioredoxin isoform X2 n=1 Tax=Choloepus didactylus TaxID=27675 RepID=UPI00189F08AE|nr:thioredoxin isoform X2 [Choloepus didactylus]